MMSEQYQKHLMKIFIFEEDEVFTGVGDVSGDNSSGDGWGPEIPVEPS